MCENNKLLPELSREELEELGFGCHGVVDILNTFYTLPSGERLALRLWAPKGYLDISEVITRPHNRTSLINIALLNHQDSVTLIESFRAVDVTEKFPAVLEYLPYRTEWSTLIGRDPRDTLL